MGPGGGNAVQGSGGKSLVSCGFCCLWQGDGEFGDAVGVDDVPADAPGDAVDDGVGGEGRLGGGGQVDCADSGSVSGWLTTKVWLGSMLLVISTSRQNKVYWA